MTHASGHGISAILSIFWGSDSADLTLTFYLLPLYTESWSHGWTESWVMFLDFPSTKYCSHCRSSHKTSVTAVRRKAFFKLDSSQGWHGRHRGSFLPGGLFTIKYEL